MAKRQLEETVLGLLLKERLVRKRFLEFRFFFFFSMMAVNWREKRMCGHALTIYGFGLKFDLSRPFRRGTTFFFTVVVVAQRFVRQLFQTHSLNFSFASKMPRHELFMSGAYFQAYEYYSYRATKRIDFDH